MRIWNKTNLIHNIGSAWCRRRLTGTRSKRQLKIINRANQLPDSLICRTIIYIRNPIAQPAAFSPTSVQEKCRPSIHIFVASSAQLKKRQKISPAHGGIFHFLCCFKSKREMHKRAVRITKTMMWALLRRTASIASALRLPPRPAFLSRVKHHSAKVPLVWAVAVPA